MKIETTLRYHFIPVKMAIINKFGKCWRGCGEKGLLVEEMQISTAIVEIGLEISQIK